MGAGAPVKRRDLLASGVAVSGALVLPGCDKPAREITGGFNGVDLARGHRLQKPLVDAASGAPAVTRRVHTVIAGGGVAGLAAARALRQRGIDDIAVLELEDSAGGNSRGTQVGGLACPMGAHYLPLPGNAAHEVQDLLEELGLRRRVAGRWMYDERHLCHSPQERLYFTGPQGAGWQDGLLPVQGVGADTLAQYQRMATLTRELQARAPFVMPAFRAPVSAEHLALDAITFDHWLAREGLSDPYLRWYLDYCCRDDYGAGSAAASAWAGLHYFASRHGFYAPGDDGVEREGLLTWPEGNAWLTRRLAAPLMGSGSAAGGASGRAASDARLHTGRVVMRIQSGRHDATVDAWNVATQTLERWQTQQVIVALPVFIASPVVVNPPDFLRRRAAHTRHAPWLVANIHLDRALFDPPGAPPSWDNVIYGSAGLGYVDAMHQSLQRVPGATVLTYYQALGDVADGRRQLQERPWTHWRDAILQALAVPHPDLPAKTTRVEITRYGHAMAVPTPGTLALALALQYGNQNGTKPASVGHLLLQQYERLTPRDGRLLFAHADWSGYSVFEEAFTRGHAAGSLRG